MTAFHGLAVLKGNEKQNIGQIEAKRVLRLSVSKKFRSLAFPTICTVTVKPSLKRCCIPAALKKFYSLDGSKSRTLRFQCACCAQPLELTVRSQQIL